jgi:hypothetical protein
MSCARVIAVGRPLTAFQASLLVRFHVCSLGAMSAHAMRCFSAAGPDRLPRMSDDITPDAEEAYFRAQVERESERHAEVAAQSTALRLVGRTLRDKLEDASDATIGRATRALKRLICCVPAKKPNAPQNPSAFLNAWYAPLLAFCPCCACCCGRPAATVASDSVYAVLGVDGNLGASPPVQTAADDVQLEQTSIEMQPLPSLGPPTSPLTALPVLASAKKPGAPSVAIAAPKHEVIANARMFTNGQAAASAAPPDALLLPLDAQQRLDLELHDFYSPGSSPTAPHDSDALSESDADLGELAELATPPSSEEDVTEEMQRSFRVSGATGRRRSLEETPAEKRKRQAKLAEKRRQREAELAAKELPKEMPKVWVQPEQVKTTLSVAAALKEAANPLAPAPSSQSATAPAATPSSAAPAAASVPALSSSAAAPVVAPAAPAVAASPPASAAPSAVASTPPEAAPPAASSPPVATPTATSSKPTTPAATAAAATTAALDEDDGIDEDALMEELKDLPE